MLNIEFVYEKNFGLFTNNKPISLLLRLLGFYWFDYRFLHAFQTRFLFHANVNTQFYLSYLPVEKKTCLFLAVCNDKTICGERDDVMNAVADKTNIFVRLETSEAWRTPYSWSFIIKSQSKDPFRQSYRRDRYFRSRLSHRLMILKFSEVTMVIWLLDHI